MGKAEQLKKQLRKKTKSKMIDPGTLPVEYFLKTGSSTLDLLCTGRRAGGFVKGIYILLVGESDTGKTYMALTCMAEASINKNFDKYSLVYDGKELGAKMNVAKFFGQEAADRIREPMYGRSETTTDFYRNLADELDAGPCIYALDSETALSHPAEDDGKGYQATTRKAFENSRKLKSAPSKLKQYGSILIIIAQTRDNINAGPFGPKKTRGGGNALKFFSDLEIWTSPAGKIWKKYRGRKWQQGIRFRARIDKNRLSGKEWDVVIPITWETGIDDLGGCVDFLVDVKHWKHKKKTKDEEADEKSSKDEGIIVVPEWKLELPREEVIQYVIEEGLIPDLKTLVYKVYKKIESAVLVNRPKRYG